MSNISYSEMYSKREEVLNTLTHFIGVMLSVVALILLVSKALKYGTTINIVGVAVFGCALISMYAASALYHGVSNPKLKRLLRKQFTGLELQVLELHNSK